MNRPAASVGICLLLGACSVGMALSGNTLPDPSVVRPGASRGDVESQFGEPIKTTRLDYGWKADVYEYEIGNEPSVARAVMYAIFDLFTLGTWEITGTPIERSQYRKERLKVYYNKSDKVAVLDAGDPPIMVAALLEEERKSEDVATKTSIVRVADSAPTKTAEPEPVSSSPPPSPKISTTTVASASSVKVADSAYRIQLASLRSRSRAEREWARVRTTWPDLLGAREPMIVKKNIAGRGVFYRVQTGGFDTLKKARSTCAKFHSEKQACLALTRS